MGLVATHLAAYNGGEKGKMDKQIMARYVDPTEQLVVELSVGNLTRSVSFYRGLGFDLVREEERFAVLAWEGHQLFLQQADHLTEPAATAVINLRVMVPDVDQFWQRATELGPRIIVPIGDRRYGLRDFTIADPDGFELRFGSWLRAQVSSQHIKENQP
jgi:catechol 2,3-dioxygenase-like lactoylglutathione lyase family enzyme